MKVELLSYYGGDQMVVDCARVSYNKIASTYSHEANAKLIKFLAKHNHWSPFSHPKLQFRIQCPIYVERQLVKTQSGVEYNCLSGDSRIRFKDTSGKNKDVKLSDLHNKWNRQSKQGNYYLQKKIKNMKCRVLNESTGEFTLSTIKNIFNSGIKDTYIIKLTDGSEIRCTDKHQIYTKDGWKTIETGLSVNDLVGKNGIIALSVSNSTVSRKLKVHFIKIESIEYYGKEQTYDIEMNAPYHNFIANGIVVHNSLSGRYVDFSDSYTKIDVWRKQSTDSKQGSAEDLDTADQSICKKIERSVIKKCKAAYKRLIKLGVSKEQARSVLPLSLNTTMIWTGSLYAFIRLYNQRNKPDAQKEIRTLVNMMLQEIIDYTGGQFDESLKAYGIL